MTTPLRTSLLCLAALAVASGCDAIDEAPDGALIDGVAAQVDYSLVDAETATLLAHHESVSDADLERRGFRRTASTGRGD